MTIQKIKMLELFESTNPVSFIVKDRQIGATTAILEYCINHPEKKIVVCFPGSSSEKVFTKKLLAKTRSDKIPNHVHLLSDNGSIPFSIIDTMFFDECAWINNLDSWEGWVVRARVKQSFFVSSINEKEGNHFNKMIRENPGKVFDFREVGVESKGEIMEQKPTTEQTMEVHRKGWGKELWICNNKQYCGKILSFRKSKKCSFHYHLNKDEVFYLQSGLMEVITCEDVEWFKKNISQESDLWRSNIQDANKLQHTIFHPGESFHVYPGLVHRMVALEDSELFEFSTHHENSDSYRLLKGD